MRLLILPALAMGVVVVALPAVASAQWVTAETDTLAGTTASERSTRFSVAVDVTNAPHAIWSVGSRVFYSRRAAAAWIPAIELSHTDANYEAHAVAVVPGTSEPCVLFSRTAFGAPAGELLLAEWNGTGFDVRELTADGVAKSGPALAMDAGGTYHVVCVVQATGVWRLRYLTNVTGTATDALLDVGPLGDFGSGASPAIAVEPAGIAHVVYRGVSGSYRIHHAENAAPGGASWSWQALTSPNLEDLASDVEIDAFGTVHVVASGDDCSLCTRRTHVFQRPSGGTWSAPAPIVHTSGLSGPSLAVDAGGLAHVALTEVSGNLTTGRIFHATSHTGWTSTLAVGNDHGTPSLAVDALGRRHLVCTTGPNTGRRDVLHLLAASTTVSVGEEMSAPSTAWRASPNPFAGRTVLRPAGGSNAVADPTRAVPVLIYDVAGRIVRRLGPTSTGGGVEYVWDGRSDAGRAVPAGVYRVAAAGGSGPVPAGERGLKVVKLP